MNSTAAANAVSNLWIFGTVQNNTGGLAEANDEAVSTTPASASKATSYYRESQVKRQRPSSNNFW
jgi:hypothetical protein